MNALSNLIYGLQNFRLFEQDEVEYYSGAIRVSLQIEASKEFAVLMELAKAAVEFRELLPGQLPSEMEYLFPALNTLVHAADKCAKLVD
jgi:hypothetical protein